MSEQVTVSSLPECDLCQATKGISKEAHYDACIPRYFWANICEECFTREGCSLGTGKGQKLVLKGSPEDVEEKEKRIEKDISPIAKLISAMHDANKAADILYYKNLPGKDEAKQLLRQALRKLEEIEEARNDDG